jgi:MFS family permease
LSIGLLTLLVLTGIPAIVEGDSGHAHDATFSPMTGMMNWAILGVGTLVLIGIGWIFAIYPPPTTIQPVEVRPRGGLYGYADKLGLFNRNSRLLLLSNLFGNRPPLGGLGFGIWHVAFNLYLISLGFGVDFIGTVLALRMLFHGILVFPAGLICDAIGRRRSFLIGGVASVVMIVLLSFTQNPTLLLVVGALSGIPLSLEHVAWEPFMMENSGEAERPYLFSMNATIGTVAIMGGSALAAILPAIFGTWVGLGASEVIPLRLTVLTVALLQAISLVPLYLIRVQEGEGMPGGISLANIQSRGVISRLVVLAALSGFGMGFVMQYYNVFFAAKFSVGSEQIGMILALGSLTAILGTLVAPVLAERLGKVRMIALTSLLAAPFFFGMAWMPGLWLAGASYLMANGLRVMAFPIFSAFSMERVQRRERATTIGLTHFAFDILNTPSTYLAGAWLAGANYGLPFGLTAGFVLLWVLFFHQFFGERVPLLQPVGEQPKLEG